MIRRPPRSTLVPYTKLVRSVHRVTRAVRALKSVEPVGDDAPPRVVQAQSVAQEVDGSAADDGDRSEEHTSELQSRQYFVCRLLLEKKKDTQRIIALLYYIHP